MCGSDGLRIWGDFWKKTGSWDLKLDEASWDSDSGPGSPEDLRSEARRVQLGLRDAPRMVRSDGTVSIVKIVYLSPRVENLKVKKVIKVSYLNYRESSVFRVFFGFLCIWTFHVYVYFIYLYRCITAIKHIQNTRWRSLTPLQRCSRCILQS